MAGHAQLKFVMMECSKTQIRLTGLNLKLIDSFGHLKFQGFSKYIRRKALVRYFLMDSLISSLKVGLKFRKF